MDTKKGTGEKQKDPYYFTFFNEKNEAKKEDEGDVTPEEVASGGKKKNQNGHKGNFINSSMITDASQDDQ